MRGRMGALLPFAEDPRRTDRGEHGAQEPEERVDAAEAEPAVWSKKTARTLWNDTSHPRCNA